MNLFSYISLTDFILTSCYSCVNAGKLGVVMQGSVEIERRNRVKGLCRNQYAITTFIHFSTDEFVVLETRRESKRDLIALPLHFQARFFWINLRDRPRDHPRKSKRLLSNALTTGDTNHVVSDTGAGSSAQIRDIAIATRDIFLQDCAAKVQDRT
jgi:hypothetical protein